MKYLATVLATALGTTLGGLAQQPTASKPASISFHFDRPGVEVPNFLLEVKEDGSATYHADQVYPHSSGTNTQPVERTLVLSAATTRRIFSEAQELHRFNFPCASSAKNIADTGRKTLRYVGMDGEGTCTYNYAQDKRVVQLTEMFQAIAATLDLGRRLDFDHRFDRLGLDASVAQLVEQAESGRAIELGTIAPTLRSLAQDSDLLERVRARAAKLLLQAESVPSS